MGSCPLNRKLQTTGIKVRTVKKDELYLPQGVPWKTAGTAGRPCCHADRAESRSPPPPPRPAQRLHAAEKQQVKIKILLIVTFLKNISYYSRIKFSKHLLPSAWDAYDVRCWDHRKVARMSCQTQRLLEPRHQEPHHRSSPRQPRWTAAKPQPRDRW